MDAEIPGQLGVDDDPAGQAQRTENVRQYVHRRSPGRESGVSVNLSGSAIILANARFT
jgi:hypothetical protein